MFSTYDSRDTSGRDYDRRQWEAEQQRIAERKAREEAELEARRSSPEYLREQEASRARQQAIEEHQAGMPRASTFLYSPSEDELKQIKRGGYRLRTNGHVPLGYFKRVAGKPGEFVNSCSRCGRWIVVDAKTGELSGTAHTETCR